MLRLAVIGAGPAGVSAALYARSRGVDVTLFEADEIGGLIAKVSKVSHFASAVEGENGPAFAARLKAQVEAAKIPVIYERVESLERKDGGFVLKTDKGVYEAAGVVLAAGSTPKALPVEVPADVRIGHFALGHEEQVRDRVVVMNGGSDGAVKEALYLAKFAKEVHIVQDQPNLLCIDEFRRALAAQTNVTVHLGSTLREIRSSGDGKITAVALGGQEEKTLEAAEGLEVFALIGQSGNGGLLGEGYQLEGGFVPLHGVVAKEEHLWIAGDIRVKAVRQVATAVSDGCLAGIEAAKAL